MEVLRATTAGFCMGVSLALKRLDEAIEQHSSGGRLLMLGPIIHNPSVLEYYKQKGVLCAGSHDDILPGDTVVIRAHGIPKTVEAALNARGARVVDATCPRVKAAQLAIAKATKGGIPLWLFGEAEHPEVRGLISYAEGACQVFSDPAASETFRCDETQPIVLAAQTTQEKAVFQTLSEHLRQRCPKLHVLSTICDATSKRQAEARAIARQVQLMLVLGGFSSGNTRRLVDVARTEGARALHAETIADLPLADLSQYARIGLTAGASTPHAMIDEVQALLESLPSGHVV